MPMDSAPTTMTTARNPFDSMCVEKSRLGTLATENVLALFIDDLPPLGKGGIGRLIERCEAVGADKALFLAHAVNVFAYEARKLKLPAIIWWRKLPSKMKN